MQQNRTNTDGFVVRRRPGRGDLSLPRPRPTLDTARHSVPPQFLIDPSKTPSQSPPVVQSREAADITQAAVGKDPRSHLDLDLTLDDTGSKKDKKTRRQRRPWTKKRVIKLISILLLLILLGVGIWFAYKFLVAGGKIFKGNPLTAVFAQGKPLKEDQYGRSNVVLFGTSEDDPGHEGADLTDSIMLASINQKTKDVFLVSIPRDLYVDYGRACPAGYQGKINALYACVKEDGGEEGAQKALQDKLGEIFGVDVQYAVHVNYTALRQAVDAVGGITVTIESKDPRGILDRNFDWDCPKGLFTCYNVKYPNGPANLNGKQALYLARARGANGITYGLEQANFNREEYQRKILIALKDKAVSAGTLANPVAVSNLLDALGNNIRTNFDAEEVKTLVKIGQEIKNENIRSIVLNDPENPLVVTGNAAGQSIVRPAAGLSDYSVLQATVKAYATGDFVALEKAKLDVLNVSQQAGLAQTKAEELRKDGFTVNVVGNAAKTLDKAPITLIDISDDKKPETLKKLESVLGVKATKEVPSGLTSLADFIVLVGAPAATDGTND